MDITSTAALFLAGPLQDIPSFEDHIYRRIVIEKVSAAIEGETRGIIFGAYLNSGMSQAARHIYSSILKHALQHLSAE